MTQKTHCRKSILTAALFLSITGIAWAESTHEPNQCLLTNDCIFTVIGSFAKALTEGSKGVQFSVGP
ncbi:MAG: hypothetical protein HYY25_01760 [Candidatus Wallbacteria bacterium]|jgi:hypothetical protein|nr:hypothetical protein [Candidatus Wallbacteria bacterium]MBI4865338.1 hypothetical protein [Candidatus Wallbacteria bacterium]